MTYGVPETNDTSGAQEQQEAGSRQIVLRNAQMLDGAVHGVHAGGELA
jgi:hypothetical protein